jgi:hypothetical protein
MSDELVFQCCFCRKKIEERRPDPCELIVISDFGRPEPDRRAQTVYCHADCLRQRADPAVPWDALDAD